MTTRELARHAVIQIANAIKLTDSRLSLLHAIDVEMFFFYIIYCNRSTFLTFFNGFIHKSIDNNFSYKA